MVTKCAQMVTIKHCLTTRNVKPRVRICDGFLHMRTYVRELLAIDAAQPNTVHSPSLPKVEHDDPNNACFLIRVVRPLPVTGRVLACADHEAVHASGGGPGLFGRMHVSLVKTVSVHLSPLFVTEPTTPVDALPAQ